VKKTYSERIGTLYKESLLKDRIKAIPKFYDEDSGFYKNISSADGVKELTDFISKFANQFEIGKHLSTRKWGRSRVARIQKSLHGYMKKILDPDQISKKAPSTVSIYRDLRGNVKDPDQQFTANDFAVIAKTEAANIKVVTQLLMWQKAGIIYVKSHLKPGKNHGDKDKKYNGKELKISYLLTHPEERITYHPGCKCWYTASYRGL